MIRIPYLPLAVGGLRAALVALLLCALTTSVAAQTETTKVDPRRRPPPPKFEDITLTSRDGVTLQCTYYPGPESKDTVPMILVHDWGGNKGDFHPIAMWMQQQLKLSVITVDLRGHGNSMRVRGMEEPIDREKLKGPALAAMVLDIEACKSHLLKMNNEGKVNIEQLGVLGTGFGATLAMKWAIQDWSVRNLPTYKQGWDVKALILASPQRTFKGFTISNELRKLTILRNISVLTMVGEEDPKAMGDAKRIHNAFERAWGEQKKEAAPLVEAPTSLQGMDLLKQAPAPVAG